MINDFSIVVSSCDKFSDLWDAHFRLFWDNWKGDVPSIYLITDKPTTKKYKGVEILVFEGDMPTRLYNACKSIDSNYILITLDDYFLISETGEDRFSYLLTNVKCRNMDYLRIYDRRYAQKKYYTDISTFSKIDLTQKYAISLYPAIWRRDFFEKCVDKDMSPWEFEPLLTQKALRYRANCFENNTGAFEILDVVRKGKVLRKANHYLKKHKIDIGDRAIIELRYEIKQSIADFIWWYMPKWVYVFARRSAEMLGFKFYSDI